MVTASDTTGAHERIRRMAEANPDAYRDELGKRVKRVRRELLAADGATAYEYLHPNARALIDRIAAAGVGTVVLDECHHLLDYWAIVLRALIARLDRPYVIGLTATLPSLEDADEYENYTRCSVTSTSRSRPRPSSRRATSPRFATSPGG